MVITLTENQVRNIISEIASDEVKFVELFNLLLENYNEFTCGVKWYDEEQDMMDAMTTITKMVLVNPSLLSSVPKNNKIYNSLMYMVKVLHGKTSIILYRVLFVKNLEDVDYSRLGDHWTWVPKIYSEGLLRYLYASAEDFMWPNLTPNDLHIIKVLAPIDNIDYGATLWAQICFGGGKKSEHEITLAKSDNIKILKSKHFPIPSSWDIEGRR
jgi:hypothetical protein